ncbi:polysaccharide pyruvyl transferase family protein [Polaribacter sp. IC063]|uniref:polysaccharide pyruvyl transferase family protein n=1 Tax=Polaribacter sp. IC063 TaxID=57031 RepID=UPI0011BFCDA8|nr:polysaccharide pyruvyl transferase family protein [Polaribacter sp. IC063]TXD51434.1 polysaccharide pyruvyl transferase family protein [Polaribacter sp. IC063]
MKKKIGILTQPLHDNYGGLLQAYALKETLASMGHNVIIVNRSSKINSRIRRYASIIKNKILGRELRPKAILSRKERGIISFNTLAFKNKYIPNLTNLITTNKGMLELNNMGFNCYVVGSDQAWRPKYSPAIRSYFLDFAEDEKNIKRISYAVSFGVSEWEFNDEDTKKCAFLAKKFDAISVREDSGVELVKNYLGTNAEHLIDPTMLLTKEHYLGIIKEEKIEKSEGTLKVYVLDKTKEKTKFLLELESKLNLKQFQVMPNKRLGLDEMNDAIEFAYPNPAKWLKGYDDAKFVVADSFHGTVFAILFNIPFIALGNKGRGMARFESLLKMFNLENRLITELNVCNVEEIISHEINWETVNRTLGTERNKAINFLKSNLE